MLDHMEPEAATEWRETLNAALPEDPDGKSTRAVPDEEFDDGFNQIKKQ